MSQLPQSGEGAGDAAFAALEPGFLVGNGRFTLIRLLGRGGMGVVWLARDESLREDVALKFLPHEIRFDAVALDDLRRETARARKLTHPNIIRIHDLYKDEREAFISMEFIDGPNLSDLRLQNPDRVLSWEFLEPLVKQLCEALDYAHGEKVVHRDLKPGNMMLDSRGRLKLSDFGIAAQVSDSVSRVSMIRHGQSGTITHMSPQQMDGKLPQVTDDIYALGATLYELLTSQAPFFTGDIAYQVRNLPPQPIRERLSDLGIDNDVPKPVAAMIMACLGKGPDQRPSSARAVAEWIGLQPTPPVQAPSTATSAVAADRPPAPMAPPPPPPVPSPAPVVSPPPPIPVASEAPMEEPAAHLTEEPEPAQRETASAGIPPWLLFAGIPLFIIFALGLGMLAWWTVSPRSRTKAAPAAAALSASAWLRSEHVLRDHAGAVNSVAFSPNQKYLASGSSDGSVCVYETDRGEIVWRASADIGVVNAVSISRDSSLLAAAGGNGLVRLFQLGSGKVSSTIRVHTSPVRAAVFSPAGPQLATGSDDGFVAVWDYERGTVIKKWSARDAPILSLAYSPKGDWLASGAQNWAVQIWDPASGQQIKMLNGHRASVWSLAFSPDGEMLASSGRERVVRLWNKGAPVSREALHWRSDVNLMYGLAFSPDSKFLLVGYRNGVSVYPADSVSRGNDRRFNGHNGAVRSIAFSPDGRAFASASDDRTVHVWPFNGDAVFRTAPPPPTTDTADANEPTNSPPATAMSSTIPLPRLNDSSFAALFNGRDLTGWHGDMRFWRVTDGVIRGEFPQLLGSRVANTALFWDGGAVQNFELRLRFRCSGGVPTVLYRASEQPDFFATGYTCSLAERSAGLGSDLLPGNATRGLAMSGRSTRTPATLKPNEWNDLLIVVRSNRFQHIINGTLVTEEWDNDSRQHRSGKIALAMDYSSSGQPNGIEFKDIELKTLAPEIEGAAPVVHPDGFVELFNGHDLADWSGDASVWSARGGVIRGNVSAKNTSQPSCLFWSGGALDNFELRFAFRLISGNSGIYYRANAIAGFGAGGYQFDILPDRPGNLLESGTDRARRVLFRVPASVQAIPLGGWHEGAIVANGGRIKHQLDGQTLCDLEDSASGRPRTGLLALEATGGPTAIEFKDIRLRRAASDRIAPATTGAWISLFDGSSLAAWQGWNGANVRGSWEILRGELRALRGGNVNLATREEFADFELELEWRVAPGGNSGIFYRVPAGVADVPKTAPEYQVVDDATRDGRNPLTAAGSIYGVVAPGSKRLAPVGSFNTARIVASGSRVEHWLNGVKILETDLANAAVQNVAFQRFRRGWGEAGQGQILLQNNGSEVTFRNIRIRRLGAN